MATATTPVVPRVNLAMSPTAITATPAERRPHSPMATATTPAVPRANLAMSPTAITATPTHQEHRSPMPPAIPLAAQWKPAARIR